MIEGPQSQLALGDAWVLFGVAAVLAVLVVSSNWRRAGLWFALAIVGQVASLALYVAGPRVAYHHYRFEHSDLRTACILGVLLVQAVLVVVALARHRAQMLATVARFLPGWRVWACAALMLAAAAKISRPADRSAGEFVLALAIQSIALGNLVLAVWALSRDELAKCARWFERWLGPSGGGAPEPGRTDRFAGCVALFAFAMAALVNVFAYERVPHVPDEIVYELHARYFAAGKLWLEPPSVPAAFDLDLMLLDAGKWYCPVPPGWPLVLALGVLAGAAWLVNPLLGACTVLVAYALFRELTDKRAARLGIVLIAVSPWFTFVNMSLMTHSCTLLCALIGALGVARSRRTGSIAWCAFGGAAVGFVALIRPLDGMLVAVALGLWSIGLGGTRLRVVAVAALVVGTALVAALTLPYNAALTGEVLNFPIQHYVDFVYGPGKNDMGFGPEKGLGWSGLDPWPGHSLREALITAQFNVFGLGSELFGWCIGSLTLAWVWLLGAKWSRTDRAMAAFVALIVGSSLFYWFNGGPDFGARYWYLVLVPCVWLTLSGWRTIEARSDEPTRVTLFVASAVLIACVTWMPWRAVDKYFGYRGVRPVEFDDTERLQNGLVLVVGSRHPDFAAAALLNRFDSSSDAPIFAWMRDRETLEQLLETEAARTFWMLDRGELVGPLSATRASALGRERLELQSIEVQPLDTDGETPR